MNVKINISGVLKWGNGGVEVTTGHEQKTETSKLLAVPLQALMIKWLISQQVRAVNTDS